MLGLSGLHRRAALLRLIRRFFEDEGFLEVDTPVRLPLAIPERHIELIEAEGQFLQASPELCMKRLLARGCTPIFQIGRCFRKGERGRRHLEEFTMIEWYRRECDYHQLMADCRALCRYLQREWPQDRHRVKSSGLRSIFPSVDVHGEWQGLTVAEAFARYSPLPLAAALHEDRFDELLSEYIEPNLGQGRPTFLYDYPRALASLSRAKPGDPQLAERFELYIGGVELANGFSELNDAAEQRQRFAEEIKAIRAAGGTGMKMPEVFLDDLQRMPEAAGIALGIDRLAMIAFDAPDISQVVPFIPEDFPLLPL